MRQRLETHQIQQRKYKINREYEKSKLIDPNSKRTMQLKQKRDIINKSKYGVTNKQINREAKIRKIGSLGLQTAGAIGLLGSGAVLTHPILSTIGAIALDATSNIYRRKVGKKAIQMMIDNMDDRPQINIRQFNSEKDYKDYYKKQGRNIITYEELMKSK